MGGSKLVQKTPHHAETNCVCRCIWTRACLCVCVGGKWYWYGAIVKQWRKGSLSQWGQTLVDLICDFTHKDHSEESQSHPSAPNTYINSPQIPQGVSGQTKSPPRHLLQGFVVLVPEHSDADCRHPAPHRCRHLTYGYHCKTHHLHLAYSHHKKEQHFGNGCTIWRGKKNLIVTNCEFFLIFF